MESQIDNPESAEYQLGIMRNIELEMAKGKRKRTLNWKLVQCYLLNHTRKGGSTSAYRHCVFLGVDPDGYTFWEKKDGNP